MGYRENYQIKIKYTINKLMFYAKKKNLSIINNKLSHTYIDIKNK